MKGCFIALFYEKTVLSNGVTVATEHMPGTHSVALGIWLRVGNRDEVEGEYGISHFMEHMLFKGTATRSALDIAMAFDAMGAEFNAFTSREATCFYARMVDEHVAEGFEVLADMVCNPKFAQADIDLEREVVIEEIARSNDQPEDQVYDLLAEGMFGGQPLGRPVLGTRDSVAAIDSERMHAYHDAHYTTENMFVVAAGNIDHELAVSLAERWLADAPIGARLERSACKAAPRPQLVQITKQTEQAHLLLGMPGYQTGCPDRFKYAVVDSALGGGMSSRLFQEVREKRGLVYSVYCSAQSFEDCGVFHMYAGTRPDNIAEVMDVSQAEIERMATNGLTPDELSRVVEYICGNLVLGMETTRTHMSRLGKRVVAGLDCMPIDEVLAAYRALTLDEVNEAAQKLLTGEPTLAVVSPYTETELKGLLGND